MANQWFKFYGAEYLSDPKMDRLTVQERSCWLTLLCMASQSNGVVKFLSVEGLLNKSGIHFNPYDSTEWDKSQNVLRTFEQYEMIIVHKNGNIEVNNWEKRQEHNLTVAERVAKSRANKKNVTSDVTNVTTEENRIEENRKENKEPKLETSSDSSLESPEEDTTDDISYVTSDEDGNILTPKTKGPRVSKSKQAINTQQYFVDECFHHFKVKPLVTPAGYYRVVAAMKTLKTLEQFEQLFREWFALGLPKEESIQITRALSDIEINKYMARHPHEFQ